MSEAVSEGRGNDVPEDIDAADAFALLGNELRIEILRALWASVEEPVGFSDLYRQVDIEDSAQFNYHLKKLLGHFVRQTEDGYELRRAGEKVVQAVVAGSFTEHPRRTINTDDPCTQCGDPLVARYQDDTMTIACPACGHGHGEYPFPPGGLTDRSDEEILRAFDQRVRHLHCLAKDGVCPECTGRMETTIEREGECCLGSELRADHVCTQCAHELCSGIGLGLLDQSDIVAFYSDHGVDLATTPYWSLKWCVNDDPIAIRSEEPWRVEITVTADDETLQVTLDGDLRIVDTKRQ